MESTISNIDGFDAEENLKYQREKMAVRQAYLDDLVLITRGAQLEVPANKRGLTEGAVKYYFTHVFLKSQMQGYRFRSIPVSQLDDDKRPFIKEVVAQEARTRQTDVIKTDRYLFLIAPVKSFGQNPYSARRFLHEDNAMGGKVVYFNAVAIPFSSLEKPKIVEHLKWSMSRMVTLQRQISTGVVELIRAMEDAHRKILLPMLEKDIAADGSDIERAIERKLLEYEQALNAHIFSKLPKGVLELAKTPDDHDYLFFNIRTLVIQLACDIRDFTGQFAASFSTAASELDLRMMSYLALIDKRKDVLFSANAGNHADPLTDPSMPLKDFEDALDEYEPKVEELKEKMRAIIRKEEEPKSQFRLLIEKIFKVEQKKVTPEMVQQEIDRTKQKCLVELIRVCKRYQTITVYLEFEGLIEEVDESIRHYALPSGVEGIGALPKLIDLWEDRAAFNFDAVREKMAFNPIKAAKKMDKEAAA